jgi:hypothetical protein|tara:strand:- start:10674 stop:11348 length:675 start_codon:yes stop_codon:yes gene_type:complete
MGFIKDTFTTRGLKNVAKYSIFNGQVQLFDRDLFIDAQQKHRFYLYVDGIPSAYIVNVNRPSYSVEVQEHILLDYILKFPTRVKWEPINFTIREIFSKNVVGSPGGNIMAKLLAHSYIPPSDISSFGQGSTTLTALRAITSPLDTARDAAFGTKNLSKENLVKSLGKIKIVSMDGDGEVFESWTLHNGMITSVKFSELSYGSEDLTDIAVGVNYDWATYEFRGT